MPAKPLSPELLKQAVDAVNAAGGNVTKAAAKLRIPRPTLLGRIRSAAARDLKTEPVAPDERRMLRSRLDTAERRAKEAERDLTRMEDLRRSVFKLRELKPVAPDWSRKPRNTLHAPGIPVLFFSDAQWGEVIRAREIDGINEFNLEIANTRYQALIDKTIELATKHMVNPKYPGIYYLRGGDMISGDIHEELRLTNDATSLVQVHDLVAAERRGIKRLADVFGRVHVISVPGNHGRQTVKPQAKQYAALNYDTLSAWMLQMAFEAEGDTRVTFATPLSGDHLFSVYGYNFLLTHGDRIGSRGGGGFIGPSITVARGHKKLIDYYARLGKLIDYTLIGHFHVRMELNGLFVNGCLPGASEYGRDNRWEPSAPEQWLLFVHPEHGVTARWPIHLAPTPRLAAAGEAIPTRR